MFSFVFHGGIPEFFSPSWGKLPLVGGGKLGASSLQGLKR